MLSLKIIWCDVPGLQFRTDDASPLWCFQNLHHSLHNSLINIVQMLISLPWEFRAIKTIILPHSCKETSKLELSKIYVERLKKNRLAKAIFLKKWNKKWCYILFPSHLKSNLQNKNHKRWLMTYSYQKSDIIQNLWLLTHCKFQAQQITTKNKFPSLLFYAHGKIKVHIWIIAKKRE